MTTTYLRRRFWFALGIVAAGAAFAVPAAAQFAGGRAAFEQRPRAEPVQFRDFFHFPFGDDRGGFGTYSPFNPFGQTRPPQTFESAKAPPPRKAETPPTSTVLVIGDSFADWLGYGLEEAMTDTPEIGIVRKIRPNSGLVRYEARADAPEWSQAVKDVLGPEKPSAIVVMVGINDRLPLRDRAPPAKSTATSPPAQGGAASPAAQGPPGVQGATPPAPPSADTAQPDSGQPPSGANEAQRRPPGGNYEFHTDKWAELYAKRIDDMIATLKAKGVPVLWVGLPAIRGAKSTSDMSYLDELYRARAEKAGITYVDVWDGFVDDRGQFAAQGPDFEGQIRRLRSFDGVYFTKAGAEKLAHYVEHELRRVMTSHVVPVALPGPEEQSPAKGNAIGARPAVGPVVPLSATAGGEGGDLAGAAGHPAQHESDPIATQVLNRGDAVAAPPGRADNFSWPRADANADGAAEIPPAPASLTAPASSPPSGPPVKNSGKNDTKSDTNKGEANKSDMKKPSEAKAQVAPNIAPARPRRTGPALDGAPPRPPLPIGPAADSVR
jgi:uncharacterized protein